MFDASGNLISGPQYFSENSSVNNGSNDQLQPQMTALADGGFLAVWNEQYNQISAQQYDASGNKVGANFVVGSSAALYDVNPTVTQLESGAVVISWVGQSNGAFRTFKIYNPDGGGQVSNGTSATWQANSAPGTDRVLETSAWSDGASEGIAAVFFNASGAAVLERYTNSGTLDGGVITVSNSASFVTIASLSDGGYVATYVDSGDIFAKLFNADGSLQTMVTIDDASGDQVNPSTYGLSNGGFVVVWLSSTSGDVYARAFDDTGAALSATTLVNASHTAGTEKLAVYASAVTELADGSIAITWADQNGGYTPYVTTLETGFGQNTTGTITFADADLTDDLSATVTSQQVSNINLQSGNSLTSDQQSKLLAGFTLDDPQISNFANGTGSTDWTYSVSKTDLAFLAAGDSVNLEFTITVSDDNGGSSTGTVNVFINGTNDAPNTNADQKVLSLSGQSANGGTNDYVDLGDVAALNPGKASFTVEGWFYWDGTVPANNDEFLVSKGMQNENDEGWAVQIRQDGNLRFSVNTNATPSSATDADVAAKQIDLIGTGVNAGWHHFAMVLDSDGTSGTLEAYLDGNSIATQANGADTDAQLTYDADGITTSSSALFGASTDGTVANFFDGQLDEIRFWNEARTSQQINDNKNQQLSGTENGLAGLWSLNGTAEDSTTYGNNGSLINSADFASQTSIQVATGTSFIGLLLGEDVDSNALTYSIQSNGTKGSVIADGPEFTYTSNGTLGSDAFDLALSDGSESGIQTVDVDIV